jgi:hypothetical protein
MYTTLSGSTPAYASQALIWAYRWCINTRICVKFFRKVACCTYCPLQRSAGYVSVLFSLSLQGGLSFLFLLLPDLHMGL